VDTDVAEKELPETYRFLPNERAHELSRRMTKASKDEAILSF